MDLVPPPDESYCDANISQQAFNFQEIKIIDDVELRNGARPEEATSYSAMQDYVLLRRKVPAGSD
ncbi:hypothetical protein F444_03035 [Phytophthora nicotianae P1976]|uniref:Uncharacterized protein n=1 Tax=Phytophthora nicotianae P1976 TaxID=1317066 RepID=A0A081AVG0_PHYNI|nr:hypothetical protein F444_03035 [Phytophthora nicotianae P1976]